MRIGNNSDAIRNNLESNEKSQGRSMKRLSSGLGINSAADNAAGLSASETMRSQIRGDDMAQRNTADAAAMLAIADAGTETIGDSLQRMRELALQASNGTYNDQQRAALQAEYGQLAEGIGQIAKGTNYNGTALLSNADGLSMQVGAGATGTSQVTLPAMDLSKLSKGIGNIGSQAMAMQSLASIDAALHQVQGVRSQVGSSMNRLDKTYANLQSMSANTADAESRIRDADMAAETTRRTRDQILEQSSLAMMAQSNKMDQGMLSLLR